VAPTICVPVGATVLGRPFFPKYARFSPKYARLSPKPKKTGGSNEPPDLYILYNLLQILSQ
ncbi:MAG: hypothetical protein FWG68_00670, partial [Defluviitaleaceae bacterium]|nr:hypothetical protein [Defluviitaleaceae bacterium]